MKKRNLITVPLILVVTLSILLGQTFFSSAKPSSISGAIFTTDETGLLVDGNIYENKLDVYLSGGPGPNAPPKAAGLPDGDYCFQVTDPPGKELLSSDDIGEREFRVIGGVIAAYLGTTHNVNSVSGIPGAIVIQLYPFDDTPNKGGVYKVWATPVDEYTDPTDPHSFWGFIPRYSKTDNYKVREIEPRPARLIVDKFNDTDGNGVFDVGEPLIPWGITVEYPGGAIETHTTPVTLDDLTEFGTYTIREDLPSGWVQTAVEIDGVPQYPPTRKVEVTIGAGDDRSVLYGNALKTLLDIFLGVPAKVTIPDDAEITWAITPAYTTPVNVTFTLYDPDMNIVYQWFDDTPPIELAGSYTHSFAVGDPTGFWTVMVIYEYTYLGAPGVLGTMGTIYVDP